MLLLEFEHRFIERATLFRFGGDGVVFFGWADELLVFGVVGEESGSWRGDGAEVFEDFLTVSVRDV